MTMQKLTSVAGVCRLGGFLALLAMIPAGEVRAVTIGHWDFETDLIAGSAADGQVVSHPSPTGAFDGALQDLSGNGNTLSAFTPDAGTPAFADMFFSSNVASSSNTGSNLSIEGLAEGTCCPGLFNDGTGNDGDLKVGGADVGALSAFTIEASVNFKDVAGFQTIVGKDGMYSQFAGPLSGMTYFEGGSGDVDGNIAPLYFQKVGDSNLFRLNFTAADGNVYIVDSQTAAAPDTWYNVAATSDGTTLRFYVNGVLENELDMVAASGSTNTAMIALDESGFEGDDATSTVPFTWSLARGMYNDAHVDRLNGFIDDVRISDEALTPDEFLNDYIASLSLVVNPENGSVSIRNDANEALSFDYYEIESASGALIASNFNGSSGWNSLSDQGIDAVDGPDAGTTAGDDPGETWAESAGSSPEILAELFLQSETVLDPGESVDLGAPYDFSIAGMGNEGDLLFRFSEKGGGLIPSRVIYSTPGSLPGDFNGDNVVDAADYTIWRDALGAGDDSVLNGNGDGVAGVGAGDYAVWKANYGNSNPGAVTNAAAAVPEPAGFAIALVALGLGICGRRLL